MDRNTFGFEIEYFIKREILQPYISKLINHTVCISTDIFSSRFGFDGIGTLTQEYRSSVYVDTSKMLSKFKMICGYLQSAWDVEFTSFLEFNCTSCDKVHGIPMGIHLSIGKPTIKHWLMAGLIYLKILLRLEGLDKSYYKRFKLYPDFCRIHPDRVEFRFIPSDPVKGLEMLKRILE